MRKILMLFAGIAVGLVLVAVTRSMSSNETKNEIPYAPEITNFRECVAAGNPVMESYPRQCRADGQTFTEVLSVSDSMTESQARAIAENICIKGGEALAAGTYNENTHTWWFDANLNSTQPGCNPACVVDVVTQTAEINWRCTGLIEPEEMSSLTGKTWTWVSATLTDGTLTTPEKSTAFTITFGADNQAAMTTDCNSMSAIYSATDTELTFSDMSSTLMFCEDSQEQLFTTFLNNVNAYRLTAEGELVLTLSDNQGELLFN